MLEAMRAARFAILILGRGHEAAGVIATDLFRRTDVWLVDIGLEAALEEGAMIATRPRYPLVHSSRDFRDLRLAPPRLRGSAGDLLAPSRR